MDDKVSKSIEITKELLERAERYARIKESRNRITESHLAVKENFRKNKTNLEKGAGREI